MESASQYANFIKPAWAPPAWLFGPVWSVLYLIIFLTFGWVIYQAISGKLSWWLALPFILNLVFNFLFTYFQFGLGNNLLASIDIVLVLGTLIWALIIIWPHFPLVVYLNIPYVLWGAYATALQLTITYLNW